MKMINKRVGIIAVAASLICLPSAWAEDKIDPAKGRDLAFTMCGQCHAIGADDTSTAPEAPAFRDLQKLYPVESLEEALGEGIVTGHPDMPEVALEPDMINNFIAYLKTL